MKNSVRAWLAAAICAVTLMLCGCEMNTFSPESLMSPPEAYGDGAAIQLAMEELLGSQITLRYPRSGEYRSAIVRADVDDDRMEEALVFYRAATEKYGARMVLLDMNDDGEWAVVSEVSGEGGEIDRVMFGDLDGDGRKDVIAGWNMYTGYSSFTAHRYIGGALHVYDLHASANENTVRTASAYTEMAVGDFDGDGADDILAVYLNAADGTSSARLICYQLESYTSRGFLSAEKDIQLSGEVLEYTSARAGMISDSQFGLLLDSRREDGYYYSEAVCWDSKKQTLTTPMSEEDMLFLRRYQPLVSYDVDHDGVLEMPGDRPMPSTDLTGFKPMYTTTWYSFNDNSLSREIDTLMCSDDGYYYILPERWEDKVTAQPNDEENSVCFYAVNEEKGYSQPIVGVRVFTLERWNELGDLPVRFGGGLVYYEQLAVTDYYVYAALVSPNAPAALATDYDEVASSFELVTQREEPTDEGYNPLTAAFDSEEPTVDQ